jgi:sulfatase maturation enzyme AslB (radical SAM superfamily)
MTFETAKNIVDLLLNDQFELINTKNVFAIIVDFIGGEPLMEIALID